MSDDLEVFITTNGTQFIAAGPSWLLFPVKWGTPDVIWLRSGYASVAKAVLYRSGLIELRSTRHMYSVNLAGETVPLTRLPPSCPPTTFLRNWVLGRENTAPFRFASHLNLEAAIYTMCKQADMANDLEERTILNNYCVSLTIDSE